MADENRTTPTSADPGRPGPADSAGGRHEAPVSPPAADAAPGQGSTSYGSQSYGSGSASPSPGAQPAPQSVGAHGSTSTYERAQTAGAGPTTPIANPTAASAQDRDRDGDRHRTAAAPVVGHTPVDRDGDGRDDRTGAVIPGTAKEMAAAQRARYGGLHMGSAFFGWLCAIGISVILLAVLSAAGLAFGLYTTLGTPQDAAAQAGSGIGLGAAIALLVVLFVAYLAGGYVAGRMARFNGTKQGLGVWLWGVIVTVLAAVAGLVLGSQYNVFDQLNLPALPIESGTATTAGLIALGAVLLATLLGAMLGGKLGSRYHRKVDRAAFEPAEA